MSCPINNNKFRAIFCDIKKALMRTWKEPFLYLLLGSVLLVQNIQGAIPILLIWVFAILVFYMVKHYFFVKPPAPEVDTQPEATPSVAPAPDNNTERATDNNSNTNCNENTNQTGEKDNG